MKIDELKQNIREINDYQICMRNLVVPKSSTITNSISKNEFYQTPTKKVLVPTKKIVRLY